MKTNELPLPQKFCGGYMYERKTSATLDGLRVPEQRRFVKDYIDKAAEAAAMAMLESAPVGAVYLVSHHPDPDQDWETESFLFRKVSPSVWEAI